MLEYAHYAIDFGQFTWLESLKQRFKDERRPLTNVPLVMQQKEKHANRKRSVVEASVEETSAKRRRPEVRKCSYSHKINMRCCL